MAQATTISTSTSTSQQVDAVTFILATYTDYIVSRGYHMIMSAASSQSTSQTDAQLDNFLKNEGYDTTAALVQQLLQNSQIQQMLVSIRANADSDRFVQDVNADTTLMQGFLAATQQAQSADSLDAINTFLTNNGYNCTSQQVASSLTNQKLNRLMSWIGPYALTVVQAVGSSETSAGPAFAVTGANSISFGSQTISGVSFNNGVLTWTNDVGTGTSGTIIFGFSTAANQPVSTPISTTNNFTGTITASAGNSLGLPAGQSMVSGTATAASQGNSGSSDDSDSDDQFQQLETWQFWAMQGVQAVIGFILLKVIEAVCKKFGWFGAAESNKFEQSIEELRSQLSEVNKKLAQIKKPSDDQDGDDDVGDKKDGVSDSNDDLGNIIEQAEKKSAGNIIAGEKDDASNIIARQNPPQEIGGESDANKNKPNDDDDFDLGDLFKDGEDIV